MSLHIDTLSGSALDAALPDLARLRIEVFRDFPYLYEGDTEYEARYMRSYRDNPNAILVAARDRARIVGAATAMPLKDHDDAAQISGNLDAERCFYCAESVLLRPYRGNGVGHRFFDLREAHGRAQGYSTFAFCAVIRAPDHPLRPSEYRPLDPFWRQRGYAPVQGLTAGFSWTDVGFDTPTQKRLQVWMKSE